MNTMQALKDFKTFILRGNVVDLAVGIVIGVAFGGLVTAFIKDLIMPIVGIFGGTPDFTGVYFTINNSRFLIGDFITVLIAFIVLAAVIFFFVVQPVNALMARRKTELPADPTTRDCPYCLSSIPIKASKCAFCTADVPITADVIA